MLVDLTEANEVHAAANEEVTVGFGRQLPRKRARRSASAGASEVVDLSAD